MSLGINLLWVATHEMGHAFGIGHSADRQAVMYPRYEGYQHDFHLGQDDIDAITYLYGNVPR